MASAQHALELLVFSLHLKLEAALTPLQANCFLCLRLDEILSRAHRRTGRLCAKMDTNAQWRKVLERHHLSFNPQILAHRRAHAKIWSLRHNRQGAPEANAHHGVFLSKSSIRLNPLSHESTHADMTLQLFAAAKRPIGVDLEWLDLDFDTSGMSSRMSAATLAPEIFLHEQERAHILALAPMARSTAMQSFWSAKEAYLKALGLGLARAMPSVCLTFPKEAWQSCLAHSVVTRVSEESPLSRPVIFPDVRFGIKDQAIAKAAMLALQYHARLPSGILIASIVML